jgi:hypothetical protein
MNSGVEVILGIGEVSHAAGVSTGTVGEGQCLCPASQLSDDCAYNVEGSNGSQGGDRSDLVGRVAASQARTVSDIREVCLPA